MFRDLSFWRDLIAFISGRPRTARERQDLAAALAAVQAAKAARDTRAIHRATERAKAARTAALARELGFARSVMK